MSFAERMRAAKAAQAQSRSATEDANAALLEEVYRGVSSLTAVVRELGRITGEPLLARLAKSSERATKRKGRAKSTFEAGIMTMVDKEENVEMVLPYLHAFARVAEKLKTADALKPPWKRSPGTRRK